MTNGGAGIPKRFETFFPRCMSRTDGVGLEPTGNTLAIAGYCWSPIARLASERADRVAEANGLTESRIRAAPAMISSSAAPKRSCKERLAATRTIAPIVPARGDSSPLTMRT
jgi:hypothetical protein